MHLLVVHAWVFYSAADYKRSVGFFTKVVHRIPGILGDDARVVGFELDLLRQKGKEAREALMAHFHQDHKDLS